MSNEELHQRYVSLRETFQCSNWRGENRLDKRESFSDNLLLQTEFNCRFLKEQYYNFVPKLNNNSANAFLKGKWKFRKARLTFQFINTSSTMTLCLKVGDIFIDTNLYFKTYLHHTFYFFYYFKANKNISVHLSFCYFSCILSLSVCVFIYLSLSVWLSPSPSLIF